MWKLQIVRSLSSHNSSYTVFLLSLVQSVEIVEAFLHGRNHHILWGGTCTNTNLSPPIIGLLYCNMWHMICPPFMNPGCSLVDMLFLIYFQFMKNKGNKTVWSPPLDCTLGWARKRRLAASFEKTAHSNCHWCLNEMKVGAKRKKDEQADIRLFFQTVSN